MGRRPALTSYASGAFCKGPEYTYPALDVLELHCNSTELSNRIKAKDLYSCTTTSTHLEEHPSSFDFAISFHSSDNKTSDCQESDLIRGLVLQSQRFAMDFFDVFRNVRRSDVFILLSCPVGQVHKRGTAYRQNYQFPAASM